MTEDEAKAKWCPFARRHPVMPYNGPVSNGLGYSTNTPPVDREAHCIASACMEWRWIKKWAAPEVRTSDNPAEDAVLKPDGGYCGLGGPPI